MAKRSTQFAREDDGYAQLEIYRRFPLKVFLASLCPVVALSVVAACVTVFMLKGAAVVFGEVVTTALAIIAFLRLYPWLQLLLFRLWKPMATLGPDGFCLKGITVSWGAVEGIRRREYGGETFVGIKLATYAISRDLPPNMARVLLQCLKKTGDHMLIPTESDTSFGPLFEVVEAFYSEAGSINALDGIYYRISYFEWVTLTAVGAFFVGTCLREAQIFSALRSNDLLGLGHQAADAFGFAIVVCVIMLVMRKLDPRMDLWGAIGRLTP